MGRPDAPKQSQKTEWITGNNAVREVLKAGRRHVHEIACVKEDDEIILAEAKKRSLKLRIAGKNELDKLGTHHQGWAARVDFYPYTALEEVIGKAPDKSTILVVDSVTDPQNLGALCRNAYCFGVDAIVMNKDQSAMVTPLVVRASAGAVEHLAICRETNLVRSLETLKEHSYWIYAADGTATDTLEKTKPSDRSALVMGSEGHGIRPLLLKTCDFKIKISMVRNFDSLNVAQAAGIILHYWNYLKDVSK